MKAIIDIKDLTDSREVMIKKEPMSIAIFIYILLAIVITALVWAGFGQLDNYVKATGEVRPNDSIATLSTSYGGKVSNVYFRDGDIVNAGDVILDFDATSVAEQKILLDKQLTQANITLDCYNLLKQSVIEEKNLFDLSSSVELYYYQYENYVSTLKTQIDQINDSGDSIANQEKEINLSIASTQKLITDDNTLLSAYQTLNNDVSEGVAYSGSNTQLKLMYNSYKSDLDKVVSIYNNYKNSYDKLKEEYDKQQAESSQSSFPESTSTESEDNSSLPTPTSTPITALTEEITKNDLEDAKFAMDSAEKDIESVKNEFLMQINTTIEELKSRISTASDELKSLQLQLDALSQTDSVEDVKEKSKNEFLVTINNSIQTIQSEIDSINNQLISINESVGNTSLEAQSTGTLVLSNEVVAGDVLSSGTQIGTIVPNSEKLKIILYIPESKISEIEIGQEVEFVISSISMSEYGKIKGVITSVSADSFTDDSSNQKFYKAEALVESTKLANSKGEVREIQTGMLVEGRVISGSQSVLNWLLDRLNFKD